MVKHDQLVPLTQFKVMDIYICVLKCLRRFLKIHVILMLIKRYETRCILYFIPSLCVFVKRSTRKCPFIKYLFKVQMYLSSNL